MAHARYDARRLLRRLRGHAGAFLVDNAFRTAARMGMLHPDAHPTRHGVEVIRDVPYRDTGSDDHLLDIYRPAGGPGPFPVVLYVHGGGFRILSKDTHWIMGLAFARRGYMVCSINYRLAPRHRFPAAIEDVCAAYTWLATHGARWGADTQRLVLAGESAGANLVTALAVCTSYKRPEPYARAVFDTGLSPKAVMPACGLLQVSDTERFSRRRKLNAFIADRVDEVSRAYLGALAARTGDPSIDLADPLCVLERSAPPDRPLPPIFAGCGTKDPLLDDTRRLKAACDALGAPCRMEIYPGEIHAFHAMVFRPAARRFWMHTYEFLEQHVGRVHGESPAAHARRRRHAG
jgi:acetyl esterase